jgi:VWFA-related protein
MWRTQECVRHVATQIPFVLKSIFLFATLVYGQEPHFRVPSRLVIAPTSVTDTHGNFVNGLTTSDFTLYDNDAPQKIYEDSDFLPISLVIAIQTNLTVEAIHPRVLELGPLLGSLVVGDGGEAAVLTFDRRVRVVQDFTGDLGRLTQTLRHIEFLYSDSHLIDATLQAIHLLKQRPAERRRILLLVSETRDEGSESKLRDAIADAELNNILIYSLNISRAHAVGRAITPVSIDPEATIKEIYNNAKNLFVENPLSILTRYTGGREYAFLKRRSLEEAIIKIGKEIHGQYLISFTPRETEESSYHVIRVELKRGDLEVRSRPGYWSLAQESATESAVH